MTDVKHEASAQVDSALRQRQPQGSVVATVLFTYIPMYELR